MRWLIPTILTLSLVGCQTGMLSAEAIRPGLQRVLDRHDDYVQKDKALSETLRKIYLQTTKLLRRVLEEAAK